jgi:aspartyl-tRNA synthetase
MAFCTQDSIMNLIENLIKNIWDKFYGTIQIPFKRIDFKSAMARYGSDKPDTRFDMEIMNLTENVDQSCFKNDKNFVEAILIPQGQVIFKEKELAEIRTQVLSETFTHLGPVYSKELLFVKAKNFLPEKLAHIVPNLHIDSNHPLNSLQSNDLIILNRRRSGYLGAHTILGRVRALFGALMEKKGMISSKNHQFLWVHSFPMFFPKMEMKRPSWSASHHPFTAPIEEHSELVFKNPSGAIGQNFDLVLNGIELGGGSIRIHNPLYQERIFKEILDMSAVNLERDFGHLLQALSHGCPPHGGIALGLDRLTSVICDTPNIRDVIAFPKLAGKDILMNSPSKLN